MKRVVLVGLLLMTLAFVAGLWAISGSPMPASSSQWTDGIDAQDCSGTVSSAVPSCELLLIVHLLPSDAFPTERTPAQTPPSAGQTLEQLEAVRGHIEAAIARIPGVVQLRTFGGAGSVGDVASTRSLLNEEPSLAIAVFRAKDAEAGAVAATVRQVLSEFMPSRNQAFARHAADRLRWAIAYDASRFVERSFAAGLNARIEALWSGTEPAPETRYLVTLVRLPGGATLDRTAALLRRASAIAFTHPAVESAMAFAGLAAGGSSSEPNVGLVFLTLRPNAARRNAEWSADKIATVLNARLAKLDGVVVARTHRAGTGLASEGVPSLAAVFSSSRGSGGDEEPSLLADVALAGHRAAK